MCEHPFGAKDLPFPDGGLAHSRREGGLRTQGKNLWPWVVGAEMGQWRLTER